MKNLNREDKIAFARVITDLIEADFVVEADEMQFFEKIIYPAGVYVKAEKNGQKGGEMI